MCGIGGIFGEENRPLVAVMNERLVHRGPDDAGLYCRAGATLGMRRLAIIDLVSGNQPIQNESGDLWIVFNGEIYNHLDLRTGLESRGHRFRTRSDTEVILHLYEEQGIETPAHLRGDFAFAIWDENRRKGFLARDQLGVKPLYFSTLDEKLIFASELSALLEDRRLALRLDPEALDLYLTFLYVPGGRTIYKDVFKLPPGCCLEFEGGSHRIRRYWDPPVEQHLECNEAELETQICSRLREAVGLRLMSDVPLGAFLSGGIDSTAVVALMSRSSPTPVRTFSIGYGPTFESFDERDYGRLVADHYGTDHHEFVVEPDIEDTICQVVEALDEPFGDSSAIPTFLVSQQAAAEVKVVLSGVGGDEVFGGYPRYLGAAWGTRYRRLPLACRKLLARLSAFIPEQESSRNLGGWARRFLSSPQDPLLQQYRRWVSFNGQTERQALYSRAFRAQLPARDTAQTYFNGLLRKVQDWPPVDQIFYADLVSYLVDDLLVMADRMGMAHSLEIRVPFCDHRLVEDLIRLPWNRKIGFFTLKKLLKRILSDELPTEILKRRKQGFMIPIGNWMRNELRPMFEHYLSRERLQRQALFDPLRVEQLLAGHFSGRARHTNQLWGLFVFQLWYERMERRLTR